MKLNSTISWIEHHQTHIKGVLHFFALVWIAITLSAAFAWPNATPYTTLMVYTGQTALAVLFATLAITPARRWATILCQKYVLTYGKRLSDWNFLIRYRRLLGLYSAFFALLHVLTYLWLDMGWILEEVWWDLTTRSFVLLGWLGLVIFILLSITSPKYMQKKLKQNWRRIHRSVYLLGPISVIHFAQTLKPGEYSYLPWAIALSLLLSHRLVFAFKKDMKSIKDNGLEATR